MRSVESVFVAKYFYIFLSKMALIRLNNQFIQITIREIEVSEFVDYYLNARVDSLLFFFICIFSCSVFVFGIHVESVLKRIRPLQEIKIVSYILYFNLLNFSNLTTEYNVWCFVTDLLQSPLPLIFRESYDASKAKNVSTLARCI